MATPPVLVYYGVSEPHALAYSIVRAAWQRGRHVAVRLATAAAVHELDRYLWCAEARAFLPHVALDSPLAAVTPVVLATARQGDGAWPRCDVLVNLAPDMPGDATRFQRIFDIVGITVTDTEAGRVRSRAYRAAGLTVEFKALATP